MRALLSVYDKTGMVELARGLHELGWDLVSSGAPPRPSPRRASPVTDIAESPASPRSSGTASSRCTPRSTAGILADRADPSTWPTSSSTASSRIDLVVVQPLPVPRPSPAIETHRHRWARDGARRGQEPCVRRRRRRPGRLRAVLDELRADGALSDRHAPAPRPHRLRPHRGLRRRDRRLVRRRADASRCPPRCTSRSSGRRQLRYGENPHQRGARYRAIGTPDLVGRRRAAQRHGAVATSTSTTPTPPGGSCTTSATEPAVVDHQARQPVRRGRRRRPRRRLPAGLECDPARRSAASWRCNRPVDAATVPSMVAAAQADVVIAPGYEPGVVEALIGRSARTPGCSRPRRPRPTARPAPDQRRLAGAGRRTTS